MVKFILTIKEKNGHMEYYGDIREMKSTTEKEMLNAVNAASIAYNQICEGLPVAEEAKNESTVLY